MTVLTFVLADAVIPAGIMGWVVLAGDEAARPPRR